MGEIRVCTGVCSVCNRDTCILEGKNDDDNKKKAKKKKPIKIEEGLSL